MAKFNVGDRIRLKDRADWLTPSGYRLANLEGQVTEDMTAGLTEEPAEFGEFIQVQLDKDGATVTVRADDLEKIKLDFKDCIKFASENPNCYVATMEGGQPRVRALGLWFADKTGFYFQVYTVKAIYKQLKENPKVEIYFFTPRKEDLGRAMRVSGKVKFVDDKKLKAKVLEDRPFLKGWIDKPEDPMLLIFQVYTGEAYFWTMAENKKEAEIKRIKF